MLTRPSYPALCASSSPLLQTELTEPGAAGNNGWPTQGSMPGHWWALIPSPAKVINDMAHMSPQPRLQLSASFVSTSKASYAVKKCKMQTQAQTKQLRHAHVAVEDHQAAILSVLFDEKRWKKIW